MNLSTLSETLDLPLSDIIRMADQHTLEVQSWLSSRSPQAAFFSGRGIRASSTGLHVPLLNLALGCDFPSETSESDIDDEIAAVIDFFTQRRVPWFWWIGAAPNPPDIAERVIKHRLSLRSPLLPAMVASLVTPVAPLTTPFEVPDSTVTVWQASTRDDLVAASHIRHAAFRFPEGIATDYFEAMPDSWLSTDTVKLYLARAGDHPPAAIGALIMGNGVPGVYVMATLPEWGRRGLGKAILARIMNDALADHHRMIVLTASRFGFPLYQQFGFERIFDYSIYMSDD